MKRIQLPENENGSIMVVTLIILALATMIGVAATITASIELQVAGNDLHYAENFYRAEAATMVGARAIEDSTSKLPDGEYTYDGEDITLAKIIKEGQSLNIPDPENIKDDTNWASGTGKISAEAPDVISDEGEGYEARFLPIEVPSKGSPLGLAGTSGTKMHEFVIYGRSIRENPISNKRLGEVIIEVGYKKRF